jgi:D-serine deaminase-like pyridoxal phosphate-dependent protein
MTHISEIPTPAAIVDLNVLDRNLRGMADRAARLGVRLRPHIKTHKSPDIARLQVGRGACGITVSTLHEARVFAAAGFDDMTWAFPAVLGRLDEALELAQENHLALLVDSIEAVTALAEAQVPLNLFLKVDCGYHRAGVDPDGPMPEEIARRISDSPLLRFAGLLTHAGHSYDHPGREALLEVAHQERDVMAGLADRLRNSGIEVPTVSIGSTPTMSVIDTLEGIDEIRPGNYVFYDLSQVLLGSCALTDCALSVLTSVVSSQPGAGHSIVDAGALALSKDAGPTGLGHDSYGMAFPGTMIEIGAPSNRLTSLAQEHGFLDAALPVGQLLRVIPNHSCLTAAQFDEYFVVEGDEVVDRWTILRGR